MVGRPAGEPADAFARVRQGDERGGHESDEDEAGDDPDGRPRAGSEGRRQTTRHWVLLGLMEETGSSGSRLVPAVRDGLSHAGWGAAPSRKSRQTPGNDDSVLYTLTSLLLLTAPLEVSSTPRQSPVPWQDPLELTAGVRARPAGRLARPHSSGGRC